MTDTTEIPTPLPTWDEYRSANADGREAIFKRWREIGMDRKRTDSSQAWGLYCDALRHGADKGFYLAIGIGRIEVEGGTVNDPWNMNGPHTAGRAGE